MTMAAATHVLRPGGLRGLLLPDHNDRLELMIDEVLLHFETTGGRGPFPVLKRLLHELVSHIEAEEQFVLPEFALAHPLEAEAIRAGHRELKAHAARVESEIALRSRAANAMLALQKTLRQHAQREDKLLHPWAVQNLDAESWKSVRSAMRALMFNVSHEREES